MRHLISITPLLRTALLADAAASAGMGLLLAAAAQPLSPLLGLPEPLLRGVGLALLPAAGLVGWMGTRARLPRWAALTLIGVGLLWVVDSVLLLGMTPLTTLGAAFVLAQAAVVAGLAGLQWAGLRQGAAHGVMAA